MNFLGYLTEPQTASGKTRILALTGVGLAAAGALYVRHFNPTTNGIFPACPFNAITGLYCPGCGLTRGYHQLFNGHILAALDYNPLIVLWTPILVYLGISYFLLGVRGKSLPLYMPSNPVLISLLVLLITFWVLRNIPFYPFTILAP